MLLDVYAGWIKSVYLSWACNQRFSCKPLLQVYSSRFSSICIHKTDSAWLEVSSWSKCGSQVTLNFILFYFFPKTFPLWYIWFDYCFSVVVLVLNHMLSFHISTTMLTRVMSLFLAFLASKEFSLPLSVS